MQQKRENLNSQTGKDILLNNLKVTSEIGSILKSSLGPRGMDKMIVGGKSSSAVTVTNDGATIMRLMTPAHPVARLLSELATAQETLASDGTTTTILLASGFSYHIRLLVESGFHPAVIRKLLQPLTRLLMKLVPAYCQQTLFLNNKSLRESFLQKKKGPGFVNEINKLEMVIANSLSSKNVSSFSNVLNPLLVRYYLASLVCGEPLSYSIFKKQGKGVSNCEFLSGSLIFEAKFSEKMKINTHQRSFCGSDTFEETQPDKKNARKAIFIQTPLLSHTVNPKPYLDSSITIRSYEQIDEIVRSRNNALRELLKTINGLNSQLGVNCLFYMKKITQDSGNYASVFDEKFVSFLAKKNIFVAELTRESFEKACTVARARPVVKLLDRKETAKHVVDLAALEKIDDSHLLIRTEQKDTTFLITASNQVLLDEVKRSLEDVLGVLELLLKADEENSLLLRGGGVFEMQCSFLLHELALLFRKSILEDSNKAFYNGLDELTEKQVSVNETVRTDVETLTKIGSKETSKLCANLASAFEDIVITLANNAAMDGVEVLGTLKNRHKNGNSMFGVDVLKRKICKEVNAIVPFKVSESAVFLTTEFISQILKIDDFVS